MKLITPTHMADQKKSSKKGKTSHELMKEHIHDKDHKVSDEDFSNMEVGADLKLQDEKPLEFPGKNHPKDEDKDPKITTPWDVLKDSQS